MLITAFEILSYLIEAGGTTQVSQTCKLDLWHM